MAYSHLRIFECQKENLIRILGSTFANIFLKKKARFCWWFETKNFLGSFFVVDPWKMIHAILLA